MACHRPGSSLVDPRADPCCSPVDRPADNCSAHPAPRAGLDSPHALSRTLPFHSAQSNLRRSPARCNRRGRLALLPAPWIRLARGPNRRQEDLEGERTRGASTITQQLVKNLFFGTGRSFLRKGAEATLVPVAEFVLGKQRILEIYLNVVEWGPGIYGAEPACRYWYEMPARNIGRQPAARLAAILPAPLKRRPERMNNYSAIILKRMSRWVGNRLQLFAV